MNVRKPAKPIPGHLLEEFYRVAWVIALTGDYSPEGRSVFGVVRPMVRRHAIAVLWSTACALRFSELRNLRVVDVSRAGYSAYISRSKGGLSGQAELSSKLIELTFEWRSHNPIINDSQWLIPSRTGNRLSNNAFNRDACGAMRSIFGIALTHHSFRCTAAQLAMLQGANLRTVKGVMGHKSLAVTEKYIEKQPAKPFRVGIFEQGDVV
jgi:integrase